MTAVNIIEGGHDYAAGLVTAAPKNLIPLGASPFIRNVDFTRFGDSIAKRKGIATEHAEKTGTGFSSVSGMWQYIKSSGTKLDIISAGNDVYSVSGSTYTSRYTGTMAGADVNFGVFKDLLVMVSATEAAYKWDGVAASFSVLLGTPPANGKFFVVWKGRGWIANTSAGKSRLHGSAANNIEDWTTANDALFIDINPDDGDQITGIATAGLVLLVFKKNSVYMVYGSSATNLEVRQVSAAQGCTYHRSIVNMGPIVIYLSQYGLHTINGSNVQGIVSQNLRSDIEGLSDTVKGSVAAGRMRNMYVMAYDSNGDGKNDIAIALDTIMGTWTTWDNQNARVFLSKDDSSLLSGGSDKIISRKHDTGEDDEGVPITMRWRSRGHDCGDWTGIKNVIDFWFQAEPLTGKTVNVRPILDGLQIEDRSISLTARTGEDILVVSMKALVTWSGRFVQFEFANSELNAPVRIYQHQAQADVQERQYDDLQ